MKQKHICPSFLNGSSGRKDNDYQARSTLAFCSPASSKKACPTGHCRNAAIPATGTYLTGFLSVDDWRRKTLSEQRFCHRSSVVMSWLLRTKSTDMPMWSGCLEEATALLLYMPGSWQCLLVAERRKRLMKLTAFASLPAFWLLSIPTQPHPNMMESATQYDYSALITINPPGNMIQSHPLRRE